MNKEPEEQREPITNSEVENEEGRHNLPGSKEELDGHESEIESIPEKAPPDHPIPKEQEVNPRNRIDRRLAQLEKVGMLPNIPHLQIQRLRIIDSLIQPIQNLRALEPPRFGIANPFPPLLGGITQGLTRSLRIPAPLPSFLNQVHLPNLGLGIGSKIPVNPEPNPTSPSTAR